MLAEQLSQISDPNPVVLSAGNSPHFPTEQQTPIIRVEATQTATEDQTIEHSENEVVDFSEELIGSSFKISNPKTKSSCGCGVSFSF